MIRESPTAAKNWILKAQAQAAEMGGATIRYITGSAANDIEPTIFKTIEDMIGRNKSDQFSRVQINILNYHEY